VLRLVTWNINRQPEAWRTLLAGGVDIALLQEAVPPPADVANRVELDLAPPWRTAGKGSHRPWRAAIARVSEAVSITPRRCAPPDETGPDDLMVSRPGTLAVADVTVAATGETITVASVYGAWENPISSVPSEWIYADASVHRLISDLSALVGTQRGHKLIVAGDLNILRGYGEHGSAYWARRYATVFDRMDAIGVPCVGPELPSGGEPPLIRPDELPSESRTVPTFRTHQTDPSAATRQLDFVFASRALHDRVTVRALNSQDEWGPSDHCRVAIDVAPPLDTSETVAAPQDRNAN